MAIRGDLQLTIGYWIVSHRSTLRKWWALGLMGIMVVSLLWMILFFALFFGQETKINTLLVHVADGAGDFQTSALQPRDVTVGEVHVIVRDATHVDVVTELTNPNADWAASTIAAHFAVNGANLATQHLFVNQSVHRPFLALNVAVADSSQVHATVELESTVWSRASAAGLPEPNFSISNIVSLPSVSTANGQVKNVITVQADILNASVYNFYRVDVPVVLMSGDQIVGAGQVTLERWPTLTKRSISITIGYAVPVNTTVRIEPQVSRFDVSNTYR